MRFAALDFETANSDRASVCAVGLAIFEEGILTDKFYRLVRPRDLYFDAYNTYIHGISEEDVENEPEFDSIWEQLEPYLTDNWLVAHNAGFDIGVLRHVLDEYDIPYPEIPYSCTRIISKQVWPGLLSYSLDHVAENLKIVFNHHHALEDAVACGRIAVEAFHKEQVSSFEELAKRVPIRNGYLFPGGYHAAITRHPSSDWRIKDIKPTVGEFDESNPFYKATVVFTGTLQSMKRQDAVQQVVNCGGKCTNSVSPKTNFLVCGDQDFTKLKDGIQSTKQKKAAALIKEGKQLEIIGEYEFLRLAGVAADQITRVIEIKGKKQLLEQPAESDHGKITFSFDESSGQLLVTDTDGHPFEDQSDYSYSLRELKSLVKKGAYTIVERAALKDIKAFETEVEGRIYGGPGGYYEVLVTALRMQGRLDEELAVLKYYLQVRGGPTKALSQRLEELNLIEDNGFAITIQF